MQMMGLKNTMSIMKLMYHPKPLMVVLLVKEVKMLLLTLELLLLLAPVLMARDVLTK